MLAAAGLFGWIIMTQLPDMLPQIAATSQEASASTPDDASDQAPADDTTQERQTTEGLSDYAAEGDGAGSGSSGSAAAGAAAGASARRTATPRGSSSGGTGSASTTGDDETRSGSASGSAGDDADEPASADDLVTPDTDAGNRSTPSASRMTQVAPLPTTTARASPTPHGLELLVRASSDTWIRVHTDGQEAYASFLYKGDSMTWRASESVRLRTGNAGGTEITINGQRIDKLGEGGAVEEREWRLLPNGDIEQREV
ncbi:MAG: DUF4115 domain-containing protein [Anaerolineae bacterium]